MFLIERSGHHTVHGKRAHPVGTPIPGTTDYSIHRICIVHGMNVDPENTKAAMIYHAGRHRCRLLSWISCRISITVCLIFHWGYWPLNRDESLMYQM